MGVAVKQNIVSGAISKVTFVTGSYVIPVANEIHIILPDGYDEYNRVDVKAVAIQAERWYAENIALLGNVSVDTFAVITTVNGGKVGFVYYDEGDSGTIPAGGIGMAMHGGLRSKGTLMVTNAVAQMVEWLNQSHV